jgi:hypothetical protein
MMSSTPERARASAVVVCALLAVSPLAAQGLVTLTFSGEITEVSAVWSPPPPFAGVGVGDAWTLSHTFDLTALDIDNSQFAGNFPDAITNLSLEIGGAATAGVPGPALAGGDSSVIGVNLGSAGVIPVAILSSASFDATTVDPATISLAGASVKLVGNGIWLGPRT